MTTINVTQQDIDSGIKGDCSLCPVARAASRAFPHHKSNVSGYHMYVMDQPGNRWRQAVLPPPAWGFISAFDSGWEVLPFSFEVDL